MSGNFTYRHHQDLRVTLYEPDENTFPVPLKYIHVMRQKETDIDNVSESAINNMWTENKNVRLFLKNGQEQPDSKSFVHDFLKEMHGFEGGPTQFQKSSRRDNTWPKAWITLSTKQKEKEIAEYAEKRICEVVVDDKDCLKVIADARRKNGK